MQLETPDQGQSDACGVPGSLSLYIYGPMWYAQSFKPRLDNLTRIELYLWKSGIVTENLVIGIRETPAGPDLGIVVKTPGEITKKWINIDFGSIPLIPEQTYYIVCRTTGGDMMNHYSWEFAYDTPYDRGSLWISNDGGGYFIEYPRIDTCFRTYGEGTISCESYQSQGECEAAGCYWYDGSCHTLSSCSPEGAQQCFDNDLYECQEGMWVLIEANSPQCIGPSPIGIPWAMIAVAAVAVVGVVWISKK